MPAPEIGLRPLLRLAIPSAIFTVLTNSYRIVDQYFVQGISVAAQAAVGSSVFVLILLYACIEFIAAGVGPLMARATGADDDEARRRSLGAALAGAAGLTLLLSLLGSGSAPWIAKTLGLSGAPAEECVRYLRALAWTLLPLVFTPVVDQSFLAMGNARTPMLLHAVALVLNLALTPLLIYTAELGITGAGLAANLSRAVPTAIGLFLLIRLTGLRRGHIGWHGELLRILRIGAPMAFGTAFFALVYWALLKTVVSPLGPHVNAALGIGFSGLESLTWPVFHGLSLGVASQVGRCLGAARPDLAKQAVRTSVPAAAVLGLLGSALFFFGAERLTALFTQDAQVHRAAIDYALILAASQWILAFEALAEGILAGAGDTRTVFWFSAPINLLRIPLAWWLAFPLGWGAAGIWWAINLTTYIKAMLKVWAVWRGRWLIVTI
jgi:MATE family multidrug resistance protein